LVTLKGVRIMGQGFSGIFRSYGARTAPSRPPIRAFLLQRNFIGILPDTASIWRELAWQSG
jgi:hypothetical protein